METIKLEKRGGVATIRLNRPEQRNAVDLTLARELREALEDVSKDTSIRAVVLTGEGRAFCAGADISQFGEGTSPEHAEAYLHENYKPIITAITSMPKPVIGAIEGAAAGAGMSIALACDLRVMSDTAALFPGFINIGLVPDAGASWFLSRQIGFARAFDFLISGKAMTAETCLSLGLANRVVRPDTLESEANSWARELAERPTKAIAMTKQCLNFSGISGLADAFSFEGQMQAVAVGSEDHAEGIRAFRAKEKPVFKGQ